MSGNDKISFYDFYKASPPNYPIFNDTNAHSSNSWQSVVPTYHHSIATFPYRTRVLRASRSQIQSSVLPQSHPPDRLLDKIHNKYISSYQYRTAWSDVPHLPVPPLQWKWLARGRRLHTICTQCTVLHPTDTDARRVLPESVDSVHRAQRGN